MSFLNRGIRATQLIGIIALVLPGWVMVPLPASASQPRLMAQVTPTPDSAMTPIEGKVNIRFINETGAVIEYQVVGDTEYRTLAGDGEMILRSLPVATSLTFRRTDSGLLRVQFRADDPPGTIVVRVSATNDFALDRTTLYIDQQGMIFFN
ncbi:MAG: hypothetical protein HC781_15565 [Leptolyngbyaceae cyanobacterium CSU_1_4]|nr:hypothetical protein [Leptolyngbyaceae cyanobacterium CSU_1_4]